jgi:hypothetical protein
MQLLGLVTVVDMWIPMAGAMRSRVEDIDRDVNEPHNMYRLGSWVWGLHNFKNQNFKQKLIGFTTLAVW